MGNFFGGLQSLIITVKANFWTSVATTVMLMALILVWSARGNISTFITQNPTVETQNLRIVRGRESDKKIEKALRDDMAEINSDRVIIRQFHDQKDSDSTSIIPYVTTTHIVNMPGVSPPVPQIINLPRSYIRDITERMFATTAKPVCIHILTTEITDEMYRKFLEQSGVYEQYICPIMDISGSASGVIIAGYLTKTKERPSQQEIFDVLSGTATQVSGYLAEVLAPEKETWLMKVLNI